MATSPHLLPTPLRYALILSYDTTDGRTFYTHPESFASTAEAIACGNRIVASGDYEAFVLTATRDFYVGAPIETVALNAQVA